MKRLLLYSIGMCLVLAISPFGHTFATKHIINVQNNFFSPSSITNVAVGDTMRWVWVSGVHTTTSTTIPAGAATWDSPMTSTNTVFEYKVTVAGTYNYKCTPHAAMGMIGSFVASAPTATLSVSPANQNVPASAGSTNFAVTSNSSWSAVSNTAWCTVTASGNGNGTIIANFVINPSLNQRVATITVTVAGLPSQTVTVTQAGAVATLVVGPTNQNVGSQAGTTSFNVNSNTNWTVQSSEPWCTVASSGTGNGTIIANYSANLQVTERIATITVTVAGLPSQMVTVTQAGATATLLVDPPNQNVVYQSGTTSFNVTSNSDWTANSDSDWCTATPSGTGNGIVTATFTENPGNAVRVATITINVDGIAPQLVTVTQNLSSVSVSEISAGTFSIYPNPTKGNFTVSSGESGGSKVEISVIDISGKIIYTQKENSSENYSFNLETLPRGVYTLRIVFDKGIKESKLILIN